MTFYSSRFSINEMCCDNGNAFHLFNKYQNAITLISQCNFADK